MNIFNFGNDNMIEDKFLFQKCVYQIGSPLHERSTLIFQKVLFQKYVYQIGSPSHKYVQRSSSHFEKDDPRWPLV